ncbi:ribosomal protein S18 acetylase RimI-like enzyme [Kribbella sp. VKM Ac-2527]|uniref:Ribosomal protein S18 acetylase RimI-like enzyme n=1 Tax=Kribbella caucasensis TaxID=2512215 RepID=A0A4R6KK99_9ACTN|nr:GNAT family N-acetyltransferase [Kribbella sp. VKM Ac-2527]TDO49996.1 ribosomal protein S18 acetylase RimI-like enzyme [Kribbella sp. VKM Ac-2527]
MIAVRRAGRDDIDAVREVGLKTWPAAYAGIVSPEFIVDGLAQWWSVEAVERGIANGITLIAEDEDEDADEDRAVGMVGLGQEEGFWVMWKLYVLPEYQARGVGKALLDAAIEALPEDANELLLDVLVGNAKAIGFYRKNGFGPAQRKPSRDLGADLMWMSLDL